MNQDTQPDPKIAELQHHFHEYFELLLGVETQRLLNAITTSSPEYAARLPTDMDVRFAYLKGAVRMGRLLGLISSEEAKTKHEVLSAQRDQLQSNFLDKFGERVDLPAYDISYSGREGMKHLLEKMVADRTEPPID